MTALAVANITHGILRNLEDGITKKRALATCSELTALAGGLPPEHFGWISIIRPADGFEDHFQHLSIFVEVKEGGARLLYRHILRELIDDENRWADAEYTGEAEINCTSIQDIDRLHRWISFASMFFHRYDGIKVAVPDDQEWF